MAKTSFPGMFATALLLAGCSATPNHHSAPEWEVPGMQLGGDHGVRMQHQSPGGKRGSDNRKLFFNPGQPEPGVNSIHRGW